MMTKACMAVLTCNWEELARDALNAEGYCVIGGYMSPVNDAYKKRLCHLASKSSEFVMVDPWEARQSTFQRSLTVLSRVKSILCESGQVPRGDWVRNTIGFQSSTI
ncbi:nicotinamide/nicotinic acid mononucleotide adenylyltransferase-like isoform X2 [Quercus lobata]|uniref:nicotinamide/nicotinic acid mononucleotide adenylyltransferase-like isoform X2 n=1 Tax=Quercus lobata TaxID=97700 RepID=UPI001244EA8F|nr:nicotinamide/nicotinic acid mononucleotide adenylyltransferase-like isoform X2 [Quercus lobata]